MESLCALRETCESYSKNVGLSCSTGVVKIGKHFMKQFVLFVIINNTIAMIQL